MRPETVESAADALIGIIAAMPEEIRPILSRMPEARAFRCGPRNLFSGKLGRSRVAILAAGEGRLRAELGARALLERFRLSALLGIGIAGGLSPGLEPLTILAGRRLTELSGPAPGSDESWVERAVRVHPGARAGTLITVDRIAASVGEKASILKASCAEGPAAVDLESAVWARAAARAAVPFLALRGIADAAGEDLPDYLEASRGRDGNIRRGRVVLRALLRPGSIPRLLMIEKRMRRCAARLADLVEKLLGGDF
jgi:adenosylhomocysteine nucleosidase